MITYVLYFVLHETFFQTIFLYANSLHICIEIKYFTPLPFKNGSHFTFSLNNWNE